jgi:hypothetical protein
MAALLNVSMPFKRSCEYCNVFYHGSKEAILLWFATDRPTERFVERSRETFGSVPDTCEKIAREKYAPFNRIADTQEPWFDGERVHLPASTHAAASRKMQTASPFYAASSRPLATSGDLPRDGRSVVLAAV